MSTIASNPRQFRQSRTCTCLCSAYLGESQARRQYLRAAERCEEEGLYVAAYAFRFTAAQEKEHADIFLCLLTALGGERPAMPEDNDVPLPEEPLAILQAVAQGEGDESDKLYPAYARIAEEEQYPRVAMAFRRIAETERLHARRFRQYEAALRDGSLFASHRRIAWLCLQCGHLHYGTGAPERCDTCNHDRGHFIRSSFEPFTVHP